MESKYKALIGVIVIVVAVVAGLWAFIEFTLGLGAFLAENFVYVIIVAIAIIIVAIVLTVTGWGKEIRDWLGI